jgi:hypothetical protein
MANPLPKSAFLTDLKTRIEQHCETVVTVFQPLEDQQLNWRPDRKEWNISQCFDHLNLTHEYYTPRIKSALDKPSPVSPAKDSYKPSFWGRIYMYFALNPRYSFPTAEAITPETAASREVLAVYLTKQTSLLEILGQVDHVDLSQTPIPIEKGVKFNLGDCLKVLVYHDALHIGQAQGVLAALGKRVHD